MQADGSAACLAVIAVQVGALVVLVALAACEGKLDSLSIFDWMSAFFLLKLLSLQYLAVCLQVLTILASPRILATPDAAGFGDRSELRPLQLI